MYYLFTYIYFYVYGCGFTVKPFIKDDRVNKKKNTQTQSDRNHKSARIFIFIPSHHLDSF